MDLLLKLVDFFISCFASSTELLDLDTCYIGIHQICSKFWRLNLYLCRLKDKEKFLRRNGGGFCWPRDRGCSSRQTLGTCSGSSLMCFSMSNELTSLLLGRKKKITKYKKVSFSFTFYRKILAKFFMNPFYVS